eukprot:SAG31_NODE_4135_length_3550_cov_2.327731_3_plen_103_part_00
MAQVGSKRFLTNKVDRSVTGLIAQQQCVGPFHTPLANCAVTAQNYMSATGTAIAIGEQPIKTLIDPAAMVRKDQLAQFPICIVYYCFELTGYALCLLSFSTG